MPSALVPGAHAFVDRIDDDSVALGIFLRTLGVAVTVACAPNEPASPALLAELQRARIPVAADRGNAAAAADIVFVHDYTSPTDPFVDAARRAGKLVAQFADVVIEFAPCPTIAVTGTAGKSSVAALVCRMLSASDKAVYSAERHYLVASKNPNRELLAQLPAMSETGRQVLELTSSHLEYMNSSPAIAIVTRIQPDHVEWHGSLRGYYDAKARIGAFQTGRDWIVANSDDAGSLEVASHAAGTPCLYSATTALERGVSIIDGMITARWDGASGPIIARDAVHLRGRQIENALAATAGSLLAGARIDAIASTLATFKGLPRRLQLVGEQGGVRAYNDGIAFAPTKAAASLETFADASVILICGGQETLDGWSVGPLHGSEPERAQLRLFARMAAQKTRCVLVVGPAASCLRLELEAGGVRATSIVECDSVAAAAREAVARAGPGDSIVLAPIFAMSDAEVDSFDEAVREAWA